MMGFPKISLFYYDTLDGGRTFSRFLQLSLHAGRTYAKVMVQKVNLTPSSSTPKFFLPACFSACSPPPSLPAHRPACKPASLPACLPTCMVRACVRPCVRACEDVYVRACVRGCVWAWVRCRALISWHCVLATPAVAPGMYRGVQRLPSNCPEGVERLF